MRLLDRLFPRICNGTYRRHHFHWKNWVKGEEVPRAGSCCAATKRRSNDFYVCCRCGYERTRPGPFGPMVWRAGNEVRRGGKS